jgi:hypothetical protein
MTHFAGDVLVVDKYGYIISNMPNTTNEGPVPADQYSPDMFYLVEFEGRCCL